MFDGTPWWLVAVGGVFVVFVAGLVVTSLHRPAPEVYRPTRVGETPSRDSTGARIVTLDARDPGEWTYFDFSRGTVVPDSAAGWDLAARRFHLIVNGGAGLGGGAGLQAAEPRSSRASREGPGGDWIETRRDGDRLVHPLLEEWYRYDFLSHLLRPRRRSYFLRTRTGHVVELEFLGYYCPGPDGGCPTFRYRRLPEGSGPAANTARSPTDGGGTR